MTGPHIPEPTIFIDDDGRTWFESSDEDIHETLEAARQRNGELARLTAYIEAIDPTMRPN